MGFRSLTASVRFSSSSRASRNLSACLALPADSARANFSSNASNLDASCARTDFCSFLVSWPPLTIASICCVSHACLASSPSASSESYCNCSASLSGCSAAIFSSSEASALLATLSTSSTRFRRAREGVLAATIFWNVASSEKAMSCSGAIASPPAEGSAAAAAAGSMRGKTCTTFRSVSVLCWYLKRPAQSFESDAPRSSLKPIFLSASERRAGRPSLYFCRTFLPPPTVNDKRTISLSGSGFAKAFCASASHASAL
mmetsp:Transcript_64889/g.177971  ORF Transcript_64889/g.177971 Transcript_64889/m.177971 type:complete len:258 (-) Transcript_64889:137-910(-)